MPIHWTEVPTSHLVQAIGRPNTVHHKRVRATSLSTSDRVRTRDRRHTCSDALCWSPQWLGPSVTQIKAAQRVGAVRLPNTSTEKVYTQSPTATV
eukprot:1517986-Amphidinium_carterae.1